MQVLVMPIFFPSKTKYLSRPGSTGLIINYSFCSQLIAGYRFIRRKIAYPFLLLGLVFPLFLTAQQGLAEAAGEDLKKEQISFLQSFHPVSMDTNIISRLRIFVGSDVDRIHESVLAYPDITDIKKSKAIRSLMYFIEKLRKDLTSQKLELYYVPDVLEIYELLLKVFLFHSPFDTKMLKPLGAVSSQLLAAAFWQYEEGKYLEDIAIYKRVVSLPDYIPQFLDQYPDFRFADSLLLFAVDYDPLRVTTALRKYRTRLEEIARRKKNIYLQEIITISKNPTASELLPFIMPLAEGKMTAENILNIRREVTGYFQLLVNTLHKYAVIQKDTSIILLNTLRSAIRNKSLSFYVDQINDLHASPDEIRFASVKDLRPMDIYYIITSCEADLYTSSYLGLYRRLMKNFGTLSADSLFEVVKYDNFRIFIRMAANYNTLADFLSRMPAETAALLLRRFVSDIENDRQTGLEKAMDVADSFAGFNSIPGIDTLFRNELVSNLNRCQEGQLYLGMRLYSILLNVFDLLKQTDAVNKLWSNLGNPELLEQKTLGNKYGEIIELVLFYGDEDGRSSFNNFLRIFKDRNDWVIDQNDLWVTIHSISGQPIYIYANRPLDEQDDKDLLAQDSLSAFLRQHGAEPVIIIHRGHSYHLNHTLKRLQPSVKLILLGSCGGNKSILEVASISPDAQIIVSKKTGSQFINDPMIEEINETLLQKKDLVWNEVWGKLKTRFRNDEFSLNLFNEYIPPSKNVSLFVFKLFNHYLQAVK